MPPKKHECDEFDHVSRVAVDEGFYKWQTVWKGNSALGRANPNTLMKGDKLQVPQKNAYEKDGCKTELRHIFKVPRYKLFLRIRLLKADFAAIKDSPYELQVEGVKDPFKKTTNKGMIEHQIPIQAKSATLTVRLKAEDTDPPKPAAPASPAPAAGPAPAPKPPPKKAEPVRGEVPVTWKLQIGRLDPIKEKAPDDNCVAGVQQRLNNLAINAGAVDGNLTPRTQAAIRAFQELFQINVKSGDEGKPTKETQERLFQVHEDPKADTKPPPPKPPPSKPANPPAKQPAPNPPPAK